MNGSPLHLLVIEDTVDDAELVALTLRRAGFDVAMRRVADLPSMVSALDEQPWDVIVSDHSMPGMTSFDALDALMRRDLDVPFIIFSGGIGEEEAVAAMRAGAKDYVMKTNIARLIPAVSRELQQAQARRLQRSAEGAIREIERMREFALDSANIATWELDRATQLVRRSPRHGALFGLPAALDVWTYQTFLDHVLVDDRALVAAAFERAWRTDAEIDIEYRVRWSAGGIHWLWSRGRRFQADLLAGIVTDISARKETEAQLAQALKMEAVGQLTGGIAHDFNNLLTVILGNSSLLANAVKAQPELSKLVERIRDAGRHGAQLTRQLLAFARQQPLALQDVDLAPRITRAASLLQQPLGPDIALQFDLAPALGSVRTDPVQLETALLNLVINARDAMPKGGMITISAHPVRGETIGRSGDFALLSVTDTGTGMPREVAARASEPFFTTKEVGKGSGLGLSMVYGFARQSDGHFAIDSAPGHGTTVKIYLPIAVTVLAKPPAPVKPPSGSTEFATTLLVVDDDLDIRDYVAAVFAGLGHHVLLAADGIEALAVLARHPEIELIFSDVAMPKGMGGLQLAKEARHLRPGLKILLTSGFSAAEILERGAFDPDIQVLEKPYDDVQLGAILAEALRDRSSGTRDGTT